MSVVDQIAEQIEALSPSHREMLLIRLREDRSPLVGKPGQTVLSAANTLDPVSAREMMDAIETECEQVDARVW